jgi:hypothetical protein
MSTLEKRIGKQVKKGLWVTIGVICFALIAFFYVRFYFVWGEGVKSGQLNNVVYKGYLFKTYEGKLIQAGLSSSSNSVQSNEFIFSVANEHVAKELMMAGGKEVDLQYKEYLGVLPWRGHSKYVVDSIIAIKDVDRSLPF